MTVFIRIQPLSGPDGVVRIETSSATPVDACAPMRWEKPPNTNCPINSHDIAQIADTVVGKTERSSRGLITLSANGNCDALSGMKRSILSTNINPRWGCARWVGGFILPSNGVHFCKFLVEIIRRPAFRDWSGGGGWGEL